MVRSFFRLVILGIAAFLFYQWVAHRLPLAGLLAILLVLSLFFLATFLKTVEEAYKDSGEDFSRYSWKNFNSGKNNFRTSENGRRVFYPYGEFGDGYYIKGAASEEEITRFLTFLNWFNWMAPFPIWNRKKILQFIQGLEIVDKESEDYDPPRIPKPIRRFLFAISISCILGGTGKIYLDGPTPDNLFTLAIGVTLLVYFSYKLRPSRR